MKITTPLRPHAQALRIPEDRPQTFAFNNGILPLPVPSELETREVWVVRFDVPHDTEEHPEGTARSLLVLDTEPTLQQRFVMFRLREAQEDLHLDNVKVEAWHRREHAAPDDATVVDRHDPRLSVIERTLQWWEVTT